MKHSWGEDMNKGRYNLMKLFGLSPAWVLIVLLAVGMGSDITAGKAGSQPIATFSIAARDPATGEFIMVGKTFILIK